MAASAISFLLTNLSTLIQKEVGLLWGVEEDMRKLSSTLSTILAVLDDAEMKQHQDKSILNWLCKLKDAAYKVGDILDECETESLKWEIKHQRSGRLKQVWTSAITRYPVVNLSFRRKIGNRMKDITVDINAIAEERMKFHLGEGFIGKGLVLADDSRETSSTLPPLEMFGRIDDQEKVVEVLTKEVSDREGFSVYPIIGMGGLGKTTLAQMIFNDERINSHFVLKIWVYVSQNFNVKMVMNQIIESASGQTCQASRLEPLEKKAKDMLSGKRFLLVLDDAWSEDQEEWDKMKPVLACGLPGSCVVVTTRSEKVASIIRTLPTHYLLPLSEDDCWSLFRLRAFGHGNNERFDLVDIGKEIVKKCGGVPLAAKALGGLMRFKREKKEWVSVKESDIWNLPPQECSILPALRLSYYNLPLELRHCFSYCALFLKGSKMEKDKVIHLWMANGFIPSKNNMEVEDVGSQIWNELYMRSFFQDKEKNWRGDISFKMHDLMHDLAKFVVGDECQIMIAGTSGSVPKQRIRHAALIHDNMIHSEIPEALKKQWSLHTILLQRSDPSTGSVFEYSWDFKQLGSLRVLDASGSGMKKFPGSVGNSKHLRYLNLSRSAISELPTSICELPNLQTLNLNYCFKLGMLPKKMNKLRGLRHLFLLGHNSVGEMPLELGKLKQLKTLSLFVVGENNGQRLGELEHLELGGELRINHLERVKDTTEAKEANLAGKPNLRIVRLYWAFSLEHLVEQRQVIEALEPHPNVEKLSIEWYGGKELPVWMGNPSVLKNVVGINLSNCSNCSELPAIWKLPCLKRLIIESLEKVEYMMKDSSYTDGGFESLEELEITNLPNLKELPVWMGNPSFLKNVVSIKLIGCSNCLALPALWQLPRLKHLEIWGMRKLEYIMIQYGNNKLATGRGRGDNNITSEGERFPSLELLNISDLPNLKGLVSMDDKDGKQEKGREHKQQQEKLQLPRLKLLFIDRCPQLTLPILPALEHLGIRDSMNVNVPKWISELTSLTSLILGGNGDLVCLPDDMFQNLTHLQELAISKFRKLKALPGNMSGLVALTKFHINHCDELECLPDGGGIGSLTALLEMNITNCPKIVCLPDSIQTLTQLQQLMLNRCSPELKRRCENGGGEDWCKIAHVPDVIVR